LITWQQELQQQERKQLQQQEQLQQERKQQELQQQELEQQELQQPFRHKRSEPEPTGQQSERTVSFLFLHVKLTKTGGKSVRP
jgi:hypothetical protein